MNLYFPLYFSQPSSRSGIYEAPNQQVTILPVQVMDRVEHNSV